MSFNSVNFDDTIVATATANGLAALGIIRVSGKDSFAYCDLLFKGKKISEQATHTIHYGHLWFEEKLLDEVLISVFRGPKSFTAEDSVEISCHGSSFIQQQILQAFLKCGARLAEPGEFTQRAFLNGRLDLAQAEAVADVIASSNQTQLDLAMHQIRGGLSNHLQSLRTRLLDFISLVELELDFGEEDVEFADRTELVERVQGILDYINPLIESFKLGNAIKNGIPVAIIGRPNAGKSSLLNALLNDDRAIVSDIAGTTRDTIEEEIHIKGISFRFIDTAGIRQTTDSIEIIGINKAHQKIEQADMVLYIFDSSNTSKSEILDDLDLIKSKNSKAKLVVIGNKSDKERMKTADQERIEHELNSKMLICSVKENSLEAVEMIRQAVWDKAQLGGVLQQDSIISNARHHQCLLEARQALEEVLQLINQKASSDLLALEMKRATQAIGDITGLISNDEVLGNIFGKFCIGK